MHWQLRQLLNLPAQEERRLIVAAQRGNHDAFNALWRLHDGPLRGFLQSRVGSDAVEDLLQEVRLGCWQSLPRYTAQARFKAWLFAIACNKCADYHRSGRYRTVELPLSETILQISDPTDTYANVDAKLWARTLLETLPVEHREVMELYYYGDLTLAEIAAVQGRNLNTVKAQFYRAHVRAVEQIPTQTSSVAKTRSSRRTKGVLLP